MRYRIEIEDGLMMLMDQNNDGHDAHALHPDRLAEAEKKVDAWAAAYAISPRTVRNTKRQLYQLLPQM